MTKVNREATDYIPPVQGKEQETARYEQKIFLLENLDCANCAAKIEAKINELDEVSSATVTFATKQLRVTASDYNALLPKMMQICSSVESEIVLKEKPETKGEKAKPISVWKQQRKSLIVLLVGTLVFVSLEVLHEVGNFTSYPWPMVLLFVAVYLMLGGSVLKEAAISIRNRQPFNENFLMSIATIGAFFIGQYPEAVGVMLFFRVGDLFEHIAVEKSRSQIMDAVDLRPEVVNLVTDNGESIIPAEQAKAGDIVLVRPGDRIPLDGRVIEGESRIDTSAVTGEPVPVKVKAGSEVISGCVNTSGVLKIEVEKVLKESMVTRILDSVENAAASKPKIDKFITRFSKIYTPTVVAIALFTAIGMPLILQQPFYPWIYTALTFLVMSCPCALVLSVPLAFFCGIGSGSKRGILFKGGVVLEALSHIKAVVLDKTGTITKGNFIVQQVHASNELSEKELLLWCASCESRSTHPIATSIVESAEERGLVIKNPTTVTEIAGKGIEAVIENRNVLCGNRGLMESRKIDLSAYHNETYGSEVLIAIDGRFEGYLTIADTVKEEAAEAIQRMKSYHAVTAMLTGDSKESAQAVAQITGIDEVHAKLLPENKLTELQRIRETYGAAMFVGDGINDAPVLAGADVGAAMGSGADAAIEAADVVFMNSNMDAIPDAIAIAKRTTSIAMQNVTFALIIKISVMTLGLLGIYSNMWLAVFADTGVAFLCILNSIRILYGRYK
ncbi:MAG: heavy metal translocating P-type ATPase [Lachnospiraceae bacterium]